MEKNIKYTYHFRPEYGRETYLLEFISGVEEETFHSDFLNAIKVLKPTFIKDSKNIWFDDDITLNIQTEEGMFSLVKDIWGLAFIMTENNQPLVNKIHSLLLNNNRFENKPVDAENYR